MLPALGSWRLLADARPRCIANRLSRSRVVAALKRPPRTSGRSTPDGRSYRGVGEATFARSARDVQLCALGPRRGWDTTASTRRLVNPRWPRRAGVGPGVSWAATTSVPPQVDVAATLESSTTIPRHHRRCSARRPSVRGSLFSPVTSVDRGDRPTRHPGRAPASSNRGRALRNAWPPIGRSLAPGPDSRDLGDVGRNRGLRLPGLARARSAPQHRDAEDRGEQ